MKKFRNKIILLIVILVVFSNISIFANSCITQDKFKIAANSKEDQTAKIQKYLDEAAKRGGGEAYLSAGSYVVKGSLTIPTGVTLTGSWEIPHHGVLDKGTTLHAYSGHDEEKGQAFIEMQEASGVKGLTILYPEQKGADIRPYPWTIHGKGSFNTVENVTFVNSYQGICIGPEGNDSHLIRNVFGCVLRRGIFIDNCKDIGRLENVHFVRHFWNRSGHDGAKDAKQYRIVAEYISKNLEAFIFARTDWQYVTNTFVYGAKVGYHFIKSEAGVCNGQFLGIGADWCRYCVLVDSSSIGILITNGEFVCGTVPKDDNTDDQIGILTTTNFKMGSLQLSNCNFWGYFNNAMQFNGTGFVSVNQASIKKTKEDKPSIVINAGRASISQVFFDRLPPHIVVNEGVKKVVISNNFAEGGVGITNNAKEKVTITDNE